MAERGDGRKRESKVGISNEEAKAQGLFTLPCDGTPGDADPWCCVADPRLLKDFLAFEARQPGEYRKLLGLALSFLTDGVRPPTIKYLREAKGLVEIRTANARIYGARMEHGGLCFLIFERHGLNSGSKAATQRDSIERARRLWQEWKRRKPGS